MNELLDFYPLISGITAMMVSQFYKFLYQGFIVKQWHFKYMFYSGGMPSSHSALVISLASAIGFSAGIDSHAFFITIIFALIVVYDSAGVRHAVGLQAKSINQIVTFWNDNNPEKPIKSTPEVLGHTPIEIVAGGILGIGIAYIFKLAI